MSSFPQKRPLMGVFVYILVLSTQKEGLALFLLMIQSKNGGLNGRIDRCIR